VARAGLLPGNWILGPSILLLSLCPSGCNQRRMTLAGQVRGASADTYRNPAAGLGTEEVVWPPGECPRRHCLDPIGSACHSPSRPFQAVRNPRIALLFSYFRPPTAPEIIVNRRWKLSSAMPEILLRGTPSRHPTVLSRLSP